MSPVCWPCNLKASLDSPANNSLWSSLAILPPTVTWMFPRLLPKAFQRDPRYARDLGQWKMDKHHNRFRPEPKSINHNPQKEGVGKASNNALHATCSMESNAVWIARVSGETMTSFASSNTACLAAFRSAHCFFPMSVMRASACSWVNWSIGLDWIGLVVIRRRKNVETCNIFFKLYIYLSMEWRTSCISQSEV